MSILISTPSESSSKLHILHSKTVSVVIMRGDCIHKIAVSMVILLHNLHDLPHNTDVVYEYSYKIKEATKEYIEESDSVFFPITIGFSKFDNKKG